MIDDEVREKGRERRRGSETFQVVGDPLVDELLWAAPSPVALHTAADVIG
jgi:hypothetical protein